MREYKVKHLAILGDLRIARCFLQLFGYLNQKNKEINQVDIKKKRYSCYDCFYNRYKLSEALLIVEKLILINRLMIGRISNH